jgi:hypothetical protein
MSYQAAGAATGAILIQEQYEAQFREAVYKNGDLLALLPEPRPSSGGNYHNWIVHRGANGSVEVFTENQGQPVPGNQSWVAAQIAHTYFRAMIQVTGHAKDALRAHIVDGIEQETLMAIEDIKDLMNTSFMGGTYGLELAVDSTSTYAGIARGSAAYWESTETAHSAALTYTALINLKESIKDNDKGGRTTHWLMPNNQVTNLFNLSGQQAIKVIGPEDAMKGYSSQTIDGSPVVGLGDMTDTVIAAMDMRPGQIEAIVHRPFTVDYQGRSGDSDVYQISWAGCVPVYLPKNHGKLTAVTA